MASDYDLMVSAAWMYYHDELTHAEIARKLQLNRVKVTRLLKRAREQGLVEIRVTAPMPPDLALSRQLEATFKLHQAIAVASPDAMAQAAANLLTYHLKPKTHIGFGWSSTVSQIAQHLTRQGDGCDCTVVDLVGNMVGKSNPYSISGKIADLLNAQLQPLPVPVIVTHAKAHTALLAEPTVQDTLKAARQVQLAFVGVGEIRPTSTLVDIGFMSPKDMHALEQQGVVGDILMHCFDIHGQYIKNDHSERIIGITWDELRQIPNVVLMAYGTKKVNALLGALRSGVVDTLITDMATAHLLIDAHNF